MTEEGAERPFSASEDVKRRSYTVVSHGPEIDLLNGVGCERADGVPQSNERDFEDDE